jgi:hypothetical protein
MRSFTASVRAIAITLSWILVGGFLPSSDLQAQTGKYTVMVYNVENLFDADGEALYDDYLSTDRYGNEQYSVADVHTKVNHIVEVFKYVKDGAGPDIAVLNELEADLTPSAYSDQTGIKAGQFLKWYSGQSLDDMLTAPIPDSIRSLPSEWLLLKGLADAGMDDYQMAVGYNPRDAQGNPENVQKNVVLSRLPIERDKTRIHPTHRARPILEVWLQEGADELVVFANHWKSGASSEKMEAIRIQNAQTVRSRINVLLQEQPDLDFIVAGDLNSSYNQQSVYDMPETGLNTVLKSSSDLENVRKNEVSAEEASLFNLWYEVPVNERGSDTYRGEWGTLIQALLSRGMFDDADFHYVDRSFRKLQKPGFNAYQTSGTPRRWSSYLDGFGYSDHLPILFEVANGSSSDTGYSDPYPHSDEMLMVDYDKPTNYFTMDDVDAADDIRENPNFYDQYFYLPVQLNDDEQLLVNGVPYKPYGPGFDAEDLLEERTEDGASAHFYGRLLNYRGTWEFLIESPEFIVSD